MMLKTPKNNLGGSKENTGSSLTKKLIDVKKR